jgi:hypothetical protein
MNRLLTIITLLAASYLTGCAGLNPFPLAARGGDTISLALGSQDGMTKANTTVTLTDSVGTVFDLTSNVRALMKLYADPTSGVYYGGDTYTTSQLMYNTAHAPWLTVMALDLPTGIATGAANINVNTTGPQKTGIASPDINQLSMGIEILTGTGSSNGFGFFWTRNGQYQNTGNLPQLEPQPQYKVLPPDVSFGTDAGYGAAEIKIQLPQSVPQPDSSAMDVVIPNLRLMTQSKCQMQWSAQDDMLTVTFTSMNGQLDILETQFSILSTMQTPFVITSTLPTIESVTLYDIDGNPVTGPAASDFSVVAQGGFEI